MEKTQNGILKAAIAGVVAVCMAAVMSMAATQPALANEDNGDLKVKPGVIIKPSDSKIDAGQGVTFKVSIVDTANKNKVLKVKAPVTIKWTNDKGNRFMESVWVGNKKQTVKKASLSTKTKNGKTSVRFVGASKGYSTVTVSTKFTYEGKTYKASGKAKIHVTGKVQRAKGLFVITGKNTCTYVKYAKNAKSQKTIYVPNKIKVGGRYFKVTKIASSAFKGSKATTVKVKAKSITKAAKVKNALKGSKVTKVKVVNNKLKKVVSKAKLGKKNVKVVKA